MATKIPKPAPETTRERWHRLSRESQKRLQQKLQPTYIGKFIVRSDYTLPTIELPSPPSGPTRPLSTLISRFYKLNRPAPPPIAEHLIRTASYVAPSIRIIRFPAHYQFTITRNPNEDKHLTMLYYIDDNRENHPLAGIFLPINFYSRPDTLSAIAHAILHKEFKPSLSNQHTLIPL